eukprot:1147821-Pelagomonas_calceolata.AAC.3
MVHSWRDEGTVRSICIRQENRMAQGTRTQIYLQARVIQRNTACFCSCLCATAVAACGRCQRDNKAAQRGSGHGLQAAAAARGGLLGGHLHG